MKRSGYLKRKTPMRRTGFKTPLIQALIDQANMLEKYGVGQKPKKRMRHATPALAARRRVYGARVRIWKQQPENRWCVVAASGVLGLPLKRRTTDCHHAAGRHGKKLLDERYWVPVSREGHDWIRDHGNEARRRGWLI